MWQTQTNFLANPIEEHRELCSILCNNLSGKRICKRIDTCICVKKKKNQSNSNGKISFNTNFSSYATIISTLWFSLPSGWCLTLCTLMDCSMPGFPVLHYLLKMIISGVGRVKSKKKHSAICAWATVNNILIINLNFSIHFQLSEKQQNSRCVRLWSRLSGR